VRIRYAFIFLMLAIGLAGFAQSNSEVDALLPQTEARIDSAAYMALAASGLIGEESSPADAYAMLMGKGWLSASHLPSAPIKLDDYCAIVMRSLGLKGGLMYSIFPGPRYAYRELVAKGIVDPSGGPKRDLPGDEVLRILRLAMDLKGGGR
jgi:hypothetical protein